MRKLLSAITVAVLIAGHPLEAAVWSASEARAQKQDKNEKERLKQEEKARERADKEARERAQLMKDVQEELDELGAALLDLQYDDAFLQDYVNELGQSLVPKETPANVVFSFRVLHDPVPNAFALPDGRVYVNSGLLAFVENEAQLAVILGHEIGHVTEGHYVQSVKNARKQALLGTIIGAGAGTVLGAIFGGKKGAAQGAAAGAAAGVLTALVRINNYGRKQEDEADGVGLRLALDRRYDARQAVAFFTKLTQVYGDQDKLSNAIWGSHSRNKDRIAYLEQQIAGDLATTYNQLRTSGSLTNGTGQMHMYSSRMIREVAIVLMDEFDRYVLAKELLERIADYRASDPKTLWALGRACKLVARTDPEKARALEYLQRAAQLDERGLYPFTHRDLGLMQARLGQTVAATESLKKYVVGHVARHYVHPMDLDEIYDYLLTFGDRNWKAPAVDPAFVRPVYRLADEEKAPTKPEPATADAGKPAVPVTKKPPAKKPGGGGGGQ
jgi:Zn-dependent protease with chaperone function